MTGTREAAEQAWVMGNRPAFPCAVDGHEGMTLREHFTSRAMQALVTGARWHHGTTSHWKAAIAAEAVAFADALIAELAK